MAYRHEEISDPNLKSRVYRTPMQARGARMAGKMRYVLGISTGLATIALIIVYFLSSHQVGPT